MSSKQRNLIRLIAIIVVLVVVAVRVFDGFDIDFVTRNSFWILVASFAAVLIASR